MSKPERIEKTERPIYCCRHCNFQLDLAIVFAVQAERVGPALCPSCRRSLPLKDYQTPPELQLQTFSIVS